MDEIKKFQDQKEENIKGLSENTLAKETGLKFMLETANNKYTYNFTWLGRPIIQYPQDIIAVQEIISSHIIADTYRWEWQHHRDKLSPSFQQSIEKGRGWSHETLAAAWASAHTCLDLMNDILRQYDALVTPAALGEAGIGIADTGSAACNAMWSLLGPPAVTLPLARGPAGMPIGVQLVAARRDDRRLLGLADWVFKKLGPA